MSLSKRISLIVAVVLFATVMGMLTILNLNSKSQALEKAQESIRELNGMLVKSLVFIMNEGVSDFDPLKQEVSKNPNVKEVKIHPTRLVDEDGSGEKKMDAIERESLKLSSNKFYNETYQGEEVLRSVQIIRAEESCIDCHSGQKGDAMAVVSVRYSLENTLADINAQFWLGLFMGLMTIALTFAVIILLINKHVTKRIYSFIKNIQILAKGNVSNKINCTGNDEIAQANESLALLQDSLSQKTEAAGKIAEGYLDIEISVASEEDELGKAMIMMRENLNKVHDNLNKTIDEQAAGNIDAFCQPELFHGAYAKLLEGVNQALGTLTTPFTAISKILNEYSQGELDKEMRLLPGKQGSLSEGVNNIRKTLKSLSEESSKLAQSTAVGNLKVRANADIFQGNYKEIISGMNRTLDNITQPLTEIMGCLDKLAEGDLTTAVKGAYQGDYARIKEAFNKTIDSLTQILSEVSTTSEKVSYSAAHVSDASQNLSQGATQQASSLEEIAASVNEFESQSAQSAGNADQANKLSDEVKNKADDGNRRMQGMVTAMNEIKESSDQINKIIKTIDEIAFQTNLLSLNAAVEAARAGVHGKGFAVVAEEVRTLAQKSAKAARETTELIEASFAKVDNGTKLASNTAQALDEIINGVSRVSDLISEIAHATEEQSKGIGEVSKGLGQIDQVTQANTAAAEESAAASQELRDQARDLTSMISRFRLKKDKYNEAKSNGFSEEAQDEYYAEEAVFGDTN